MEEHDTDPLDLAGLDDVDASGLPAGDNAEEGGGDDGGDGGAPEETEEQRIDRLVTERAEQIVNARFAALAGRPAGEPQDAPLPRRQHPGFLPEEIRDNAVDESVRYLDTMQQAMRDVTALFTQSGVTPTETELEAIRSQLREVPSGQLAGLVQRKGHLMAARSVYGDRALKENGARKRNPATPAPVGNRGAAPTGSKSQRLASAFEEKFGVKPTKADMANITSAFGGGL